MGREVATRSNAYWTKDRATLDWKFKAGDKVRIAMQRRPAQKGYIGNWSEKIFVIATRMPTALVTYTSSRTWLATIQKERFTATSFSRTL